MTWAASSPAYGGYYETGELAGHRLMIRQTANLRWVVRVDGKPARGSYGTAAAARTAAEQTARSAA